MMYGTSFTDNRNNASINNYRAPLLAGSFHSPGTSQCFMIKTHKFDFLFRFESSVFQCYNPVQNIPVTYNQKYGR
jgi:hypothetical protein